MNAEIAALEYNIGYTISHIETLEALISIPTTPYHQMTVESINESLGYPLATPTLENMLVKAWEALLNFFRQIYNGIKRIFEADEVMEKNTIKKAKDTIDEVKKLDANGGYSVRKVSIPGNLAVLIDKDSLDTGRLNTAFKDTYSAAGQLNTTYTRYIRGLSSDSPIETPPTDKIHATMSGLTKHIFYKNTSITTKKDTTPHKYIFDSEPVSSGGTDFKGDLARTISMQYPNIISLIGILESLSDIRKEHLRTLETFDGKLAKGKDVYKREDLKQIKILHSLITNISDIFYVKASDNLQLLVADIERLAALVLANK